MRHSFTYVLPLAIPFAFADVEFVSPYGGANVGVAGGEVTIDVSWNDSGRAPLISDLTIYTLSLYTGGNEDNNMVEVTPFVSGGDFATGNAASGTIPAGIVESITNGFFFKMISTASQGGTVINYSDRFSINGLTGSTKSPFKGAAEALSDTTDGPSRVVDIPGLVVSSSAAVSSSTTMPTQSNPTVTVTTGTGRNHRPTTSSSSAPSSHPSSSLDTGKLAGIIIGVLAILSILIGVCIGLFCIRKKRKQREGPVSLGDNDGRRTMELQQAQYSTGQLSALGTEQNRAEMDDGTRPPEMDSMNVRAELPAVPPVIHEVMGSPVTSIAGSPVSPLSRTGTGTLGSQDRLQRFASRDGLVSREGLEDMSPVTPSERV